MKVLERRGFLRKPLKVIVRLTGEVGEGVMHFASADVSEGGVFIESDLLFEMGDIVKVEFSLPGETESIKVKGRVVRINKEKVEKGDDLTAGMGLRFIDLDNKSEEKIKRYFSQR